MLGSVARVRPPRARGVPGTCRLPQRKLSKISTDGAVRGDTSRAPWTRWRVLLLLCQRHARPPEVLDAPTRWPRSRRRAASTRPRAPPRGDASRGVRDRLHPSSSGRHESTVETRTVGPPSLSRRARARRRRRARIPAWRRRLSPRRVSRPSRSRGDARDAGPRVSGWSAARRVSRRILFIPRTLAPRTTRCSRRLARRRRTTAWRADKCRRV